MRLAANDRGISVARVALAWLLTKLFVTSMIIRARTREQLLDDMAAMDVRLTNEQITALDAASALPSECPSWMVERQYREQRAEPAPAASKKAA
jgi:aryl-alcohol dehydrogenase-like predicted oxidoreductase